MTCSRTKRKNGLLFTLLILSSMLGGCASMVDSAIGNVLEAVVETTVDTVVDTTVDVVVDAVVHTATDVVLDTFIDCIDNDRPVLEGVLPNPVLNQEYNAVVHVGIRNEPYDNAFDYTFELVGHYPEGMQTEINGRQFKLTGIPAMAGEYNFNIRVKVEDGPYGAKDTAGLCSTIDDEPVQWTIQQAEIETLSS